MSASSFYEAEPRCLFVGTFFSYVFRDGVVAHIFPPVLGTEAGATHMRGRRPTTGLHPQPSSFFPPWDLILILLCAHFYVKSISFLKELLPRVPFCNFSELHFELSRSVIKTWWLSPCGFLVLFPSPTFICLCCLCVVQFWTACSCSRQLLLGEGSRHPQHRPGSLAPTQVRI